MPDRLPVEDDRSPRPLIGDGNSHTVYTLPQILDDRTAALFLAIDGNFPAAVHQVEREMLGERFKATMSCRNAAGTENTKFWLSHPTSALRAFATLRKQ